jgi:hypothetical protein
MRKMGEIKCLVLSLRQWILVPKLAVVGEDSLVLAVIFTDISSPSPRQGCYATTGIAL